MRGMALLVAAGAAAGFGPALAGGLDGPARAVSAVLAPAYDASAGSDVRALGIALQSVAMVEGDLAGVTEEELAGWGWTRSGTTAARVWLDGERFVVHARDVRPGASTLQLTSEDLVVRQLPADQAWPDAADGEMSPGLVVVPARLSEG